MKSNHEGRDETDVAYKMECVRHRYEPAPAAKAAPVASGGCKAHA